MSSNSNQNQPNTGNLEGSAAVKVAMIGTIGAVLGTLIAGVVTFTVGWLQFSDHDAKGDNPARSQTVQTTPTAQPTPAVQRVINSPEENQNVPVECDVSGVITNLPDDKSIVIADRESPSGRIFFEQSVSLTANGQWRATVDLGDPGNTSESIGKKYEIYAVVMDKAWATYLSRTSTEGPDDTYWSSQGLPPGASLGEPRHVKRIATGGKC